MRFSVPVITFLLITFFVIIECFQLNMKTSRYPLRSRKPLKKSTIDFASSRRKLEYPPAYAIELGQQRREDGHILSLTEIKGSHCNKKCYFDKVTRCSKDNVCAIDSRPCDANRDYFDHIYNCNKKNKKVEEKLKLRISGKQLALMFDAHYRVTPYARPKKYYRKEQLLKRKKLMLMSTWVPSLLPDPSQGKDWILNFVIDSLKFTTRGLLVLLYYFHQMKGVYFPKPRFLIL